MAKKILIIDDEPDVAKVVVYRLKAKGYEVFIAASGKEGIDLAETQKPDLILLDYRLPDMLASQVAEEIRRREYLKHIPFILITASSEDIAEKAKVCLTADYISKPIESYELYAKVEKYLAII